jgi:hypothetical protein
MLERVGNYDGYPVGTVIGKDGTEIQLFVTESGQWVAEITDGRTVTDWQRSGLVDQINKLTKRKIAKVSVPVTKVSRRQAYQGGGIVIRRGVLTGIHSANDNPLATWVLAGREVKEQITDGALGKNDGVYFELLAKEQIDELVGLIKAKEEAVNAYRAFVKEHGMDVRATILNALDNAKE